MLSVSIIGYGNVGAYLANRFLNCEKTQVVEVFSSTQHLKDYSDFCFSDSLSTLKEADCYILAVPDRAISSVAEGIQYTDKLIIHTSGATPIKVLSRFNRAGVFYPLQTFTRNQDLTQDTFPICIEATNKEDLTLLQQLAYCVTEQIHILDSNTRMHLHLAAVFASNFSNLAYHFSDTILKKVGLASTLLKPLLEETVSKALKTSPKEAQTGPAVRFDNNTLEAHKVLLNSYSEETKDFYTYCTQLIQDIHGKKL